MLHYLLFPPSHLSKRQGEGPNESSDRTRNATRRVQLYTSQKRLIQVRSSETKNLDDKALIEPETQLEEFSSPRPRRDYFQARSSERKILDDRVVVDMHYDNDGLDIDDDEEEKTLVRQRLKFSNLGKTE